MPKARTRASTSTSEKKGATRQDVPDVLASAFRTADENGCVTILRNSTLTAGVLVVQIVNVQLCDNLHLYMVPGPCPQCATSRTGEVQS